MFCREHDTLNGWYLSQFSLRIFKDKKSHPFKDYFETQIARLFANKDLHIMNIIYLNKMFDCNPDYFKGNND